MLPFEISEKFGDFNKLYPECEDLIQIIKSGPYYEKLEIARLWLSEGIPYAFKNCPIIYEKIRGWMAYRFGIHAKEITLIGSGRIGYSLAPHPKLGKAFDSTSDLDFSAITNKLFDQCVYAFDLWSDDYSKGIVSATNSAEKYYWGENLKTVPNNISKGFIDPYKIPLREKYKIAQLIESTLWMLKEKLMRTKGTPQIKRASLRVYKSWDAFLNQLRINLSAALTKI
jgi:hypothetical protein